VNVIAEISLDHTTIRRLRQNGLHSLGGSINAPGFFREQIGSLRILTLAMFSHVKKRSLSAHQRQIRFFTSLCVLAITLLTALVFWLINAPDFPGR